MEISQKRPKISTIAEFKSAAYELLEENDSTIIQRLPSFFASLNNNLIILLSEIMQKPYNSDMPLERKELAAREYF
ncbi:MAG: hypothetical protein ABII07_05130 [Patescibacteria group bacterium]|nr:hypothetical protein [Patescibacteria group bacterium]